MKKFSKLFLFASIFILLFTSSSASAYVLITKYKKSDYDDLYYYIDNAFTDMGYESMMKSGLTSWHSGTKIRFTKQVSITGNVNLDYIGSTLFNDAYATHSGGSSTSSNIAFYKKWKDLKSDTRKKETVVHEVGHALGLDHTQKANDANSVMRQYDFNDKAYPLSDDLAGIKALYK